MKIAIITDSHECAAMASWIAENALCTAELERWIIDPVPDVAEQVLDALAAQWLRTPVDMLIFPAGSPAMNWRRDSPGACMAAASVRFWLWMCDKAW